ncbi:tetratricopeptide repeat protein [Leptolyngbya sp. 7M]|uniref:tetratricopeptide repeat protein n=1 Tax=Leptolyngbya sp. 7M TaxID=2812896 RepID=UPI001B8C0434|nr:tetratricopeptide repeat protein [Leptolyngbya sp. 7M]QYO66776.1 tetratricopeptide repeat protein [Leptolyngbya sp. 7M]
MKLFRSADQTFYGKSLRTGGRFTLRGGIFAAFAMLWLALVAHSGYIRYHESAGARAFENITIPDELALATSDPSRWLTQADRGNVQIGKDHLHRAMRSGLFTNVDAMPKLAWLEYLAGNKETAAELLDKAAALSTGRQRTLSLYYRGAILSRSGRAEEALVSLKSALETSSDLAAGYEELGEALWRLGRVEEAEAAWQAAVKKGSGLPLANNFLAGAAEVRSAMDTAATFERRAEQFTPRDARFRWMLGTRLKNLGMDRIAEKQFSEARKLDTGLKQ